MKAIRFYAKKKYKIKKFVFTTQKPFWLKGQWAILPCIGLQIVKPEFILIDRSTNLYFSFLFLGIIWPFLQIEIQHDLIFVETGPAPT